MERRAICGWEEAGREGPGPCRRLNTGKPAMKACKAAAVWHPTLGAAEGGPAYTSQPAHAGWPQLFQDDDVGGPGSTAPFTAAPPRMVVPKSRWNGQGGQLTSAGVLKEDCEWTVGRHCPQSNTVVGRGPLRTRPGRMGSAEWLSTLRQ